MLDIRKGNLNETLSPMMLLKKEGIKTPTFILKIKGC